MDIISQKTVIGPLCGKLIRQHSSRYTNEEGQAVHAICYEELLLEVIPNRITQSPARPLSAWLEQPGKSPKEQALKSRLKELLRGD